MIKQIAHSLGFDAFGIAKADELTDDARFMESWLKSGQHGEMDYLARNFEKRIDPRKLVTGCKSVVVVLMNYFPSQKQDVSVPQIAKYSYSETDYHTVMKAKLNELDKQICAIYGSESVNNHQQHIFVDSAPVLERRWAERAGLGWIGKHTQLIHPGLGSYTYIGILLLNIETEYDTPIPSRCGTCNRCIDACPTKALKNGSLDARRCISYLTIENKKDIPVEFQSQLSNCVLGCDICADICPWNKKWAKHHAHNELKPIPQIIDWQYNDWKNVTEADFKFTFCHSAILRAGFNKLKRNIENVNLSEAKSDLLK